MLVISELCWNIFGISCVTSGNLQEILRSPVVNGGKGSEIWKGHIPYEM